MAFMCIRNFIISYHCKIKVKQFFLTKCNFQSLVKALQNDFASPLIYTYKN